MDQNSELSGPIPTDIAKTQVLNIRLRVHCRIEGTKNQKIKEFVVRFCFLEPSKAAATKYHQHDYLSMS